MDDQQAHFKKGFTLEPITGITVKSCIRKYDLLFLKILLTVQVYHHPVGVVKISRVIPWFMVGRGMPTLSKDHLQLKI